MLSCLYILANKKNMRYQRTLQADLKALSVETTLKLK